MCSNKSGWGWGPWWKPNEENNVDSNFPAEHCPPRAPHGLQTKGPDWGTSNNYWMVSLVVINIIVLSHDKKGWWYLLPPGNQLWWWTQERRLIWVAVCRQSASPSLSSRSSWPIDHPFPHPQDDFSLDCPALQDSAEKHSVIWRNAAGDEVQQDGRSHLSSWQIIDPWSWRPWCILCIW